MFPRSTVPIGTRTVSSPFSSGRKPLRENHQALGVKCEKHPTCGAESNSGCRARTRTRAVAVRGKPATTNERNMANLPMILMMYYKK